MDREAEAASQVDCCAADARIARTFDRRARDWAVGRDLPPIHAVSARLRDALGDVAVRRPSLLEIGCGSGALTVELLERGAVGATGIDLSAASIEAATLRAARTGVVDRVTFRVGDGAELSADAADWVVLDRVICCYPDPERLLASSIAAARRRIAFSVPVSWGWRARLKRLHLALEAATAGLRGNPCPGYVHDVRRIEARLGQAGFRRLRASAQGFWYVAVFELPTG